MVAGGFHACLLLQRGRVHRDEVEAAHRAFMIERLRIPAQVPPVQLLRLVQRCIPHCRAGSCLPACSSRLLDISRWPSCAGQRGCPS